MPFPKAFTRLILAALLAGNLTAAKPLLAQVIAQNQSSAPLPGANPGAPSASSAATPAAPAAAQTTAAASPVNDLATKPVNPKILPFIKEGYAFLSKGSYDKAARVLKKAIALDKDSISARRYLAYALIQTGSAKEALADMQVVAKLVPPNAFDFYLFAASYYAAGGVQEAKDCYTEALRQNPAYDAARAGLVKTLTRQHNFEEALNNVQQGLQLSKDESVRKYYASLGKAVTEAQTYAQQTATVNPLPNNGGPAGLSTQTDAGSVKSQPVVIK